ncbi:MAG TPA: PhnD/SsuA/transferrin family substrate-binding protein [Oscillospiraceae bacterium]|nr:PhnD/SsuA/transferrin family substrate-binding protein [Oscillospiraceae bacterium]
MKKFLAIFLSLLMLTAFSGCFAKTGEQPSEPVSEPVSESSLPEISEPAYEGATINIGMLKGPTGMGAAWLMEQSALGATVNDYNFTIAGAADVLTAQLLSGEMDIAALPTNAISTLYNKTNGGIEILGVNTLGVLYVLENGDSVQSVADLAGKTILASGQGTTAEYVLTYVLSQNGLTAGEDVEIFWATEHSESATLALAGEYDVVMLPEPFVTSVMAQSADFRVALDLTAEWETLGGGELAMGGVAVRKEFAEANPEAVAAFLAEYGDSIAYTQEHTADVSALIEKYEIATAPVAQSALPRCNIVWYTGEEMKAPLGSFYQVLYEYNPAAIGGALPGEDFYYQA